MSRPISRRFRDKKIQQAIRNYTATISDAEKNQLYQNLQNFYNSNWLGYGLAGNQTNYNPTTPTGQQQIANAYQYARKNNQNFLSTLLTTIFGEQLAQALTYKEIGSGGEAIVKASKASPRVRKYTSIPRKEMNGRNQIPYVIPSKYIGFKNGQYIYTQPKAQIIPREEIPNALNKLDVQMAARGWDRVTHPNLYGRAYTNGRTVISDLDYGNLAMRNGQVGIVDLIQETPLEFVTALERKGGKIRKYGNTK